MKNFSPKMLSKKRKVDSECRVFKDEWTWKYFFTVFRDKPLCLICNETVAVYKEYNISRHFNSKHNDVKVRAMTEEERKQKAEDLRKKLSGQQSIFKKGNSSQRAATHASYVVAYNIAKSNKALSDGEFVKHCMLKVCDILCPDKRKDFETISLSRKTVTSRIEAIDKNILSQLESKIGQFKFCSITMDESSDINDTAQLLLFIRGVDENFCITEELACMRSLKGTTTGSDIFHEFMEGISTLKVPINCICSITTDGAKNMTGKKSGFVGIFNEKYPGNNVIFLHCIIHQDALCKSALDMKPVLDVIVKLVNAIRSRGLAHRQFRVFLESMQSEYSDILYYSKVRWLSAGRVFERVWQLKDEIVTFFLEKQGSVEYKILEDTAWLSDFTFFTDLLCHMNKLNVKMQGKNQFIDDIWGHLKGFKLQLLLFANQLAKNDLSHFPRLNSIAPVMKEKLKSYEDSLRRLHGEFERRFEDFSVIEKDFEIFSMPFNVNCETVKPDLQLELIELQCNTQLKQLFLNVPKLEFYKSLSKSTFPNLISHAQKVTAMFASSYICEQVFSTMKLRKSCLRNRLTDEHLTSLLRISASQFEPNYEKLLEMQSQFHSSHSPS